MYVIKVQELLKLEGDGVVPVHTIYITLFHGFEIASSQLCCLYYQILAAAVEAQFRLLQS